MSKRLSGLLLSAAMVSGPVVFAGTPPETGQSGGAMRTDAVQSTARVSTTLRMRGIVGGYEASTRILSLSTSNGTLRFPLAPTARIRQDSQQIDAAALQQLAGYRAAVRYSESGGQKTVESVHVFSKANRF